MNIDDYHINEKSESNEIRFIRNTAQTENEFFNSLELIECIFNFDIEKFYYKSFFSEYYENEIITKEQIEFIKLKFR